jgi:hypothetical protein
MKKLLLLATWIIAFTQLSAQIASNDSSVVLASETGLEFAVAVVEEPAAAPPESFVFLPPENTREIPCKPRSFSDQAYIKMGSKKPNDVSMEFLDARGNKIKAIHFITREGIRIYQGDLEAGQYYYTIKDGKQPVGYGKFVIQ